MTGLSIFGALTAVFLGSAVGLYKSARLKQRSEQLSELCSILRDIQTEIRCNKTELFKIIEKFSHRSQFLKNISDCLPETPFDSVWNVETMRLPLSDDDKTIILSVGKSLGRSDAQGQIAMLEANGQLLRDSLETARKEEEKKGKMYRRVGMLIGLLVAVIIL